MPMSRSGLGVASLLLVAACGGIPFWSREGTRPATDDMQAPPRIKVEFQDVHYDGRVLSGLVLVSPEGRNLRLHRRFSPDVQQVADCARQPTVSIIMDHFGSKPHPDDLLILEPGYWYGHRVSFTLFDEYFTGIGPECIDARLLISSFDGKLVADVPIRAVRPPVPATDGGVPEGLRHLINSPAFSDLKKLPEVDLNELPDVSDAGVPPPP